ncbi:uncharacterized protein LOC122512870 [Leptopilina heterotoma]|uniref:uncharacterized protein LOC122512870 n=1 Tax=Leptopilina heterotoma TaxID=63436 RepID=UPI001CA86E99|nr:uncharacterized protein LOC122512870 [Leptopilina heterotoma]
MENSIFLQVPVDFQFLSVCHYIINLGIIFNQENLITIDESNQTIIILNKLFDYLDSSENESDTKFQLLHKMLKGTDLYGGGDYQELDMKYVNETYQYLIGTTLFAHYGNINEYLARVIRQSDDITYSVFKENVFNHFSQNYQIRDYCSKDGKTNTKLTDFAMEKIFNDYIWQIFPEPQSTEMSIMDVDYIYAMIGLKIVRSTPGDVPLCDFKNCLIIAQELDYQQVDDEPTYKMFLSLFSIPALFYYAYNEKSQFDNQISKLDDKFWNEAYQKFFSYFHSSVNNIVQEIIDNNLYDKLRTERELLKSRTVIATEILNNHCKFPYGNYVSDDDVSSFKTQPHWLAKITFASCDDLPSLNDYYGAQFKYVRETYNKIERNTLRQVLVDSGLIEKITFDAVVKIANVPPYPQRCNMCSPKPRIPNIDIYLIFAIIKNGENEFYAFTQENNILTLIINSGDEQSFSKAIVNDSSVRMEIFTHAMILKRINEDYTSFISRVADMKTKKYVNSLMTYYNDPTTGEKIFGYLKLLIPFYTCIEDIIDNNIVEATLGCSLDVISLIPLTGYSSKFANVLSGSLLRAVSENSVKIATLGLKEGLKLGLLQLSKITVTTVAKQIINTNFLKKVAFFFLRQIDPGFELCFRLGKLGYKTLHSTYQLMYKRFKKFSLNKNLLQVLKTMTTNLEKMVVTSDLGGLARKVLTKKSGNHQMIRYYYPGGNNYIGPKCAEAFGEIVEIRTIRGREGKSYVKRIKTEEQKPYFREFDMNTGHVNKETLEMGVDGILQIVKADKKNKQYYVKVEIIKVPK